jgi:serine/threonine protein kinase
MKPGIVVSHYRVLEPLGSGGMGLVYKGEDTRLGRFVAIKFLSADLETDKAALERFQSSGNLHRSRYRRLHR